MRININNFLQKYVYRPSDRLTNDYRIPSILAAILIFAGDITFAVFNSSSTNGWIITTGIIGFLGSLLITPAIIGFSFLYNHNHDHTRNRRIARTFLKILNTRGPLPESVIEQHYNAHHLFNLRKDLANIIFNGADTANLFTRSGPRYDTVKPAADTETSLTVPPPINNDYTTAYYQLYARLQAIRQHPELATVQDSLIDDLYGIC